jgi:hypothetical protein
MPEVVVKGAKTMEKVEMWVIKESKVYHLLPSLEFIGFQ